MNTTEPDEFPPGGYLGWDDDIEYIGHVTPPADAVCVLKRDPRDEAWMEWST